MQMQPPDTEENLNRIIGLIYSAPLMPQHWPVLLSGLASYFGAFGTQLNVFDFGVDRPYFSITHGCEWLTPERLKRYSELSPTDPRIPYSYAHLGMPSHCRQTCDEKALHASDIYKELLGPGDSEYALAVFLQDERRIISFGAMRRKATGPFNQDDCGRLGLLIPHLRRAVRVQGLLSQSAYTQQLAQSVFEAMTIGAMLVTVDMRPLFVSALAERALAQTGCNPVAGELLTLSDGKANGALRQAVRQIVSVPSDAPVPAPIVVELPASGNRPIRAIVASIRDDRARPLLGNVAEPCALILLSDPEVPLEDLSEQLQRLYGLTPAEIAIATGVLSGMGPKDQAAERGVSHETVRSQIKSVLRKTRMASQAELTTLLRNLPRWPTTPPPSDGETLGA